MAYNEQLTRRIREALSGVRGVEEKRMFRGVVFMVKGKMCITAGDSRIMVRIDPELHDEALERNGCSTVKMGGRTYRGFVHVDEEGYKSQKQFDFWIRLALDFNKRAKASRKKKSK